MPDLKRPNYFTGKLLTPADFQAEQDYHRTKAQLHNRFLHGLGVVTGLQVSVENSTEGSAVHVEPGVALDPAGNELELDECRKLPIANSCEAFEVRIRYLERLSYELPKSSRTKTSKTQPKWIVETSEIVIVSEPSKVDPANPATAGVALARIVQRGRRWHVDRRFKAPRAR